ncbi:MAG: DoxX family protein [Gaiellales bacterium]
MSLGLLLIRAVFGLTLAAHGSQKLFGSFGGGGPAGTTTFFRSLGFRAPLLMAVVAGLGELVGGLLFAFGLLTPLAALILTVVMLNAIATVHWKKGFFNSAGGYEFNLAIIATALAVTAIGPGRYSLDHAIGWAETISGRWWALEVVVLAALIAFVTLTVGRTHTTPARPEEPAAPSNGRNPQTIRLGRPAEARPRKERAS